jgi:hypothetical protein
VPNNKAQSSRSQAVIRYMPVLDTIVSINAHNPITQAKLTAVRMGFVLNGRAADTTGGSGDGVVRVVVQRSHCRMLFLSRACYDVAGGRGG